MDNGVKKRRLITRGEFSLAYAVVMFLLVSVFVGLLYWVTVELDRAVRTQVERFRADVAAAHQTALVQQAERFLLQLAAERASKTDADLQRLRLSTEDLAVELSPRHAAASASAAAFTSEQDGYRIVFSAEADTYVSFSCAAWFAADQSQTSAAAALAEMMVPAARNLLVPHRELPGWAWVIAAAEPGIGAVYPGVGGPGSSFDLTGQPWYQLCRTQRSLVWSKAYADPFGQGPVLTIARPLNLTSLTAGVIAVSVNLERERARWFDFQILPRAVSFWVDSQGTVIAAAGPSPSGSRAVQLEMAGLRVGERLTLAGDRADAVEQSLFAGEQDVSRVRIGGRDYFLAYAPMLNRGWSFCLLVGIAEVEDAASPLLTTLDKNAQTITTLLTHFGDRFRRFAAILLLPAAFLLVGFGWYLFRKQNVARRSDDRG